MKSILPMLSHYTNVSVSSIYTDVSVGSAVAIRSRHFEPFAVGGRCDVVWGALRSCLFADQELRQLLREDEKRHGPKNAVVLGCDMSHCAQEAREGGLRPV